MNIVNFAGSMLATARLHDSGAAVQGINESRLGLANQVGPHMSAGEVANMAAQDKALELQGVQAKMNYDVAQAMLFAAAERKKKDKELHQRLVDAGGIFI